MDRPGANAFAVEKAGVQLFGLDVRLVNAAFEISLFVFSRATLFTAIDDAAAEASAPRHGPAVTDGKPKLHHGVTWPRQGPGMNAVVFSYAEPNAPRLTRGLIRAVEAATGRKRLKRLYLENVERPTPGESFWQAAVRLLALDVRFDPAALARIPREGPVVIVANHPYGVLDGVVIAWLAEQVRPDFRVLTHALLLQAPEARPNLLPVDFAGTAEARRTNLKSRTAARRHLEGGGCVVVFPAGAISTAPDRFGRRPAIDGPWQPFATQLIQRSRATVVPVHFAGQNSRLFQVASHLSVTLRLALIFREVRSRIGTAVPVTIGAPVGYEELAGLADRHAMTDVLRGMVDGLGASAFPSAP